MQKLTSMCSTWTLHLVRVSISDQQWSKLRIQATTFLQTITEQESSNSQKCRRRLQLLKEGSHLSTISEKPWWKSKLTKWLPLTNRLLQRLVPTMSLQSLNLDLLMSKPHHKSLMQESTQMRDIRTFPVPCLIICRLNLREYLHWYKQIQNKCQSNFKPTLPRNQ